MSTRSCTGRTWAAGPVVVLLSLAVLTLASCRREGGGEGGTATTAPPTTEALTTEAPTAPAAAHVRREIHRLSAPQIDAYRKGVALMKRRPASDKTSWIYQANIHDLPKTNAICAVTPGPKQEAWATCQHGNFFFLAWHRMYLYYFERILRAAVREAMHDPNYAFSLPYWDYENAAYHQLPAPFRSPAAASNPLYVARRASYCNNGSECVTAEEASDEDAMGLLPFCNCPPGKSCTGCQAGLEPDETFGSQFTPVPQHTAGNFGELEQQPHNVVHGAVGGNTGWMSYLQCAARDPIFWLHHANIDRLWQVWLNQGGGRANPLGADDWKNHKFVFFDEKKTKVTLTGCQILNMISQLDYQYEGLPVKNVVLCQPAGAPGGPPPTAPAPPPRKVLAQSAAAAVEVGSAPVTVKVALPAPAKDRMQSLAAAGPGRLRLVIEGLTLLAPGANFQVYLNLPEGAAPDPKSPNFVGHVSTFGADHPLEGSRSFDITDEVAALRQAGQWTGEMRVTFVRASREKREGVAAPGEPKSFIRFRRITVLER